MAVAYVLYNEKAGDGNTLETVSLLPIVIHDEVKFISVTEVSDYRVFLEGLDGDDYVILAGGDGTLNRFVNDINGIKLKNEVLYFPNGTGNDFARDLGYDGECNPFPITEQLRKLPTVCVNGNSYRFVNGVGYGIDGYCCEIGDEMRETSKKRVNYTAIAIKGLLFRYKPTNAKVTVDGKTKIYERVWLAPSMNGRFYGGGMMPTPEQKRNSGELSVMVFHGAGKIRTLMIFPSIFKGKHTKRTHYVDIIKGKEITVEFDRPVALQIDGETVLGVSRYTAKASEAALHK